MIAAVAAELVVGASSVTRYQRAGVRIHETDMTGAGTDDDGPPDAPGGPESSDPSD